MTGARRAAPGLRRGPEAALRWWRGATAGLRPLPDVVIIGTQRGRTTSLFEWLAAHPAVSPAFTKEVHYFDRFYENGESWYRAHFPLRRGGRLALEATPYLLFHPLAPQRAAADLPPGTRFVALLRDPVQRAVSHYWHSRRIGAEDQPLEVALAREDERLAGQEDVVREGHESFAYRNFSYRARGHYAEQLRRWFEAVGRERLLVLRSEDLYAGSPRIGLVLEWLGLPPHDAPFPAANEAPRRQPEDEAVLAGLRDHFAPYNEDLYTLLGERLWER